MGKHIGVEVGVFTIRAHILCTFTTMAKGTKMVQELVKPIILVAGFLVTLLALGTVALWQSRE